MFALPLRITQSGVVPRRWTEVRAAACAALALAAVALAWFQPAHSAALLLALGICFARSQRRTASQVGPYRLGAKIGEGGMGVVYRASHTSGQRAAAVKLLPAERAGLRARRRFEREAQLTQRLRHPNTIRIYDHGCTPDGTLYYAMEYLDGLDLQHLVEREGPQPAQRVASILAQLTAALDEAHRAGLIHRDVKPANVMLCDGERVKVLDFGLIKSLDARGTGADTEIDRIVGTPLYLSPEALTAPETVDARSDLYAVGALGYFLLTGVPPFSGRNVLEVCGHQLHSTPLPPSQRLGAALPSELEGLILACLAKAPAARPSSAAQLAAAFERIAAHEQAPLAA
ncbi:MAG TPA: serine/threonine-protein kinase [Polyangiales bacterium]|nr:serine/threonine-protein kinase [Polyangiales bacterium]